MAHSSVSLPATAHCRQCGVERRVTGTLGPGDGRNHLTLSTCGYVVGRDAAKVEQTVTHVVAVERSNSTRYPYQALCSCGWVSPTYVRAHAAQIMADDHLAGA